jgi:hypothetical protein
MTERLEQAISRLRTLPTDKQAAIVTLILEENDFLEDEEFEAIADQLANEFQQFAGANAPVLSDYAVSRAGIYEEHP